MTVRMDLSTVTKKVSEATYLGTKDTLDVLVKASEPLDTREISHLHRRLATMLGELPNQSYTSYTLRIIYDANK